MKLPTEILQEIIQYSDLDTLTRVTLGFPIKKEKLIEEGGPGKLLDEFLRRNCNLEYLKEWIPGECALTYGVHIRDPKKILEMDRIWNTNMFSNQGYILSVNIGFKWGVENIKHDIEEPIQHFVITKQWDMIKRPIAPRQCHPKYLVDVPMEKLEKDTLQLLSVYKGGKGDYPGIIYDCLFHRMYKDAAKIGMEIGHDIILDIISQQDVKAFRHIGLNDREVQAHESFLDGYPNEDTIWLDDQIEDELEEKYYNSFELCCWLDRYYFRNRELNTMIEKAKWFVDGIRRVVVDDVEFAEMAMYKDGVIYYPNPSNAIIYDIDTLSMILFFWAKYGSESISIT
ncbi:hypothetical protein BJ944DRAFT_260569 [Cunninghamella echinulata]|nr:hypothetical protein BJ944DRAFT_260569 [Cunninghamella echinulata]